jgi:hypothetical protein
MTSSKILARHAARKPVFVQHILHEFTHMHTHTYICTYMHTYAYIHISHMCVPADVVVISIGSAYGVARAACVATRTPAAVAVGQDALIYIHR